MTVFAVSVDVAAAPEAVYRFVADEYADNHPRWDADIVAVQLDGLVRAGARGCETRRFGPRAVTTRFEVLAAERPSRLVLRDEPAAWALTRTYEICRLGPESARLTLVFDMQPRALAFRLAYPLVRRLLRRQVRATVNRLGRLVEHAH